MKALFIVNRRSGVKGRIDAGAIIREQSGWEIEVAEAEQKQDLDSIIGRAIAEHVDVVFAVGGDGTVHEVAKRLIGTSLPLGIVPTGSGNGLARHLGFSMNARDVLRTYQRVTTIDTATVNGIPFIGTMGVGFDAWVADAFASAGVRGMATYVRVGVGGFFKYTRQMYQIEVDGERIERKALLIAVANASQYGNNARIAPVASLQDGLLDLVIVERASLFAIPRLFTGTLHRAAGITMRRGSHIEIRRPAPGPAHLDGEPVTLPEVLTIRIVPKSLRVLLPDSMSAI
ncbi:MAG TPA: YegS/Rv2252/BmrU family lipid kinase [Thermoanaerobaculia bacterium]